MKDCGLMLNWKWNSNLNRCRQSYGEMGIICWRKGNCAVNFQQENREEVHNRFFHCE